MRITQVPFYRLPLNPKQRIGEVGIIQDRNGKLYVDGSLVEQLEPSGDFLAMTLADGRSYYVISSELDKARKPRRR